MHKLLKSMLIGAVLFPCHAMAVDLYGYFNQGATVINLTTNTLLITDPASTGWQNHPLTIGYETSIIYAAKQFTVPSGQTFSRTVNIYSGVDNSPICSNSSYLILKINSEVQNPPISSNPLRCKVSNYVKYDSTYGKIFGFEIEVTD